VRAVPNAPAAAAAPAAPAPAPAPRAAPLSAGDTAQLKALLEAAGIEGLDPSSDAARTLGAMLRSAVGGMMEVLRARERMKDELRVRGTTFKAANNNPLKFSANVDDAFHNLFVKRNTAYLDPAAAFEDAFRDVRDHQAAFLSAMRLAFESMLAQLDPNQLQEEFDRQIKKGSILGVPAKLRYWDLYRDKYSNLAKDAQNAFRVLFGDAFAKAYEEQLERLQGLARSREK
jgi:type VI secretion system FHA domain protein